MERSHQRTVLDLYSFVVRGSVVGCPVVWFCATADNLAPVVPELPTETGEGVFFLVQPLVQGYGFGFGPFPQLFCFVVQLHSLKHGFEFSIRFGNFTTRSFRIPHRQATVFFGEVQILLENLFSGVESL